jgi:hypothetical protein
MAASPRPTSMRPCTGASSHAHRPGPARCAGVSCRASAASARCRSRWHRRPGAGRPGPGVPPPPNGLHATNLMLATENLADHLTHFYLFFMPDFHPPGLRRGPGMPRPCAGSTPKRASRCAKPPQARQRWFERCWAPWVASGPTRRRWSRADRPAPWTRPSACACWPRCASSAAFWSDPVWLPRWKPWPRSTARRAVALACAGPNAGAGAWVATSASSCRWCATRAGGPRPWPGSLPELRGLPSAMAAAGRWPGGVWRCGQRCQPNLWYLRASPKTPPSAWLARTGRPLHPLHGLTRPEPDKPGAYTWNKAPRLGGAEVVETGAIARQLTSGHALVRDAVAATVARCTPGCWRGWSSWPAWCPDGAAGCMALAPTEAFCVRRAARRSARVWA